MRVLYPSLLSFATLFCSTTGWGTMPPSMLTAQVTITVKGVKPQIITADYHLSHPVAKLDFSRTAPGLRARMWNMQTPDLKIQNNSVISLDEKPFDHFLILVNPDTQLQNLNYVPASEFSDGSIALFTGYFNIEGEHANTIFRFISPNEPVIAYGRKVTKQEVFSPKHDGIYVYFGKLKPIETKDSVLLLDPALPIWINIALRQEVPAIVGFYTDQYAIQLPQRPFVLFNWINKNSGESPGLQGDSLDGNISFVLSGAMWREKIADTESRLAKLIAHELAHQWNAALFAPVNFESNGGSWLAEGQAEFAANETAHHFGWLSTQDVLKNYTADINDCLQDPDPRPIGEQRENSSAIYGCGVTFNLLAQAALQRHNPPYSFFTLWRAIYKYAAQHREQYSAQVYIDTLKQFSGDEKLAELTDRLVTKSTDGKNQMLIAALERLGITFTKITPATTNPDFGQTAMQPLFAAIMKTDCHGSVSFYTLENGFKIDPLKGCGILKQPYVITAINEEPLFTHGVAAYQAVESGCAHKQNIRLTVKDIARPLIVKCPTDISPLPPMIQLTGLPWLNKSTTKNVNNDYPPPNISLQTP